MLFISFTDTLSYPFLIMDYPSNQRFEAGVHGVLSDAAGMPICEQRFNYLYAMVKDDRTLTDLMERAFRELVERVFLEFGDCDCPGCSRSAPEVPFESVTIQQPQPTQAQSQAVPTGTRAGRCKFCKWCKKCKDIYMRTLQIVKQGWSLPKSQFSRRSSVRAQVHKVEAPSVLDEKSDKCEPYAATTKKNHLIQQQTMCGPSTSQTSGPAELEGKYWAELLGDYGPSTPQGHHHGHQSYLVSPLKTATPSMTSTEPAFVSPQAQSIYSSSIPSSASSMTQSIHQCIGSSGGLTPQETSNPFQQAAGSLYGSLHGRKDSWDSNATLVAKSPSDPFADSCFQPTNYQGISASCEQRAHQPYQISAMIPNAAPNPNSAVRRFPGVSMQQRGTWVVAADEQFSLPLGDGGKATGSDRMFSSKCILHGCRC